jgi:hypothetical protein
MLNRSNQEGKNQAADSDRSYVSAPPAVSLPKGGGAIQGMGEKFATNPATGTGSMSVPIATSPGRSGLEPQLTLSYDSGAGNGSFGLGWNLSTPSITRKTDKGLPRYFDAEESDVFILSGAEDLVPVLERNAQGDWERKSLPPRNINGTIYHIQRYYPRVEGSFDRIERWTNQNDPSETFWRSVSKDNITTWYGKDNNSRIADPDDPTRIFSWLICERYDDQGNVIVYRYKEEDSAQVNLSQTHERNRTDQSRSANRYLKRIQYGNHEPYRPNLEAEQSWPTLPGDDEWFFEVVFDYGEHDLKAPQPADSGLWSIRNDPFSSYRAGFEIRTYRLCQRVLMFHHFPEAEGVGQDCLVQSTEFTYSHEENPTDARNPIYSQLIAVTQRGYQRNSKGSYTQKSLPPLEFTYSEPKIDETVRDVDPDSLENLPEGLDGTRYQWVDLDGEGLSGILTEQGNGWFYKRNLSPINFVQTNGAEQVEASFAPVEQVGRKPASSLSSGTQFLDLAGDGRQELVSFSAATPGFYERTSTEDWETWVPFKRLPILDWDNPNLKFIDLNGDGHSDILITEDECLVWHPSLAEDGFDAAERSPQFGDEEKGPRVVFADSTQSIYLADLSGDGLTDIVRIRNGEVCYWPNLGYGRFGAKVTMDNAPWFDAPDIFDQRRIQLTDIDGSGATDILYLSGNGVQVYFNHSGNSWAAKQVLRSFPPIDSVTSVTALDLLGNGTACLVWSSPQPGNSHRVMRYIDLMGGQKPHLLLKTANNLGAETVVQYAPSTKFYLQDKLTDKPWITKLPFPVHVVERVETLDRLTGNRFVSRYRYHHGYFDGEEREFRGFAFVEQWDTETYGESLTTGSNTVEKEFHVPPAYTKTWFHTGVYRDRQHISRLLAEDYYAEDSNAILLADTILPSDLSAEEERESCRSLRGQILRQEIYALDESSQSQHPYSVSERNYQIKLLQPRYNEQYAVFFTHEREAITYNYERHPDDPRVTQQMTLEVDEFGNVTKSAKIAYPRRNSAFPEQQTPLITYSEDDFINRPDAQDFYRVGVTDETRTYEITGLSVSEDSPASGAKFLNAVGSAEEIAYEVTPTSGGVQKRLIERERTRYYQDDLSDALPWGQVESRALPYRTDKLALTQGLVDDVFGNRVSDTILKQGKYRFEDGVWWIASNRKVFDPSVFYQPIETIDPFGQTFSNTYDSYALFVEQTTDPLNNAVSVTQNYRVLKPQEISDANGNRSAVAFDALGMVVGTAVMGKESENRGDSFRDFTPNLEQSATTAHIENPFSNPHQLLGTATTRMIYDLWRYYREGKPTVVCTLKRETHVSELDTEETTKIQQSFLYSDGFEREIQSKIQAEPGLAPARDPNTGELVIADGEVQMTQTDPRWVGKGRTIYNNKGKPVKQYEPFFSNTHKYEDEKDLVEWGVTPILRYDP